MKQRYFILTIGVTAAALSGLYFIGPHETPSVSEGGDHQTSLATLTPEPTVSKEQSPVPLSSHEYVAPGTVLSYDISYGGQIGDSHYVLSGNLTLAVLEAGRRQSPQLGWVRLTAQNAPDAIKAMMPELHAGTYVLMNAAGFGLSLPDAAELKRRGLAAPRLNHTTLAFWRTLGERLTVAFPRSQLRDFRDNENHSDVKVAASYSYSGSCQSLGDAPIPFEKSWHSAATASQADGARTVSGQAKGALAPHCRGLAHLELRESETFSGSDHRLIGQTDLTLHLIATANKTLATLHREYVNQSAPAEGSSDPLQAGDRAIDAAQVRDLDESQLLAVLRQQGGREPLTQDQYLQLKSWLALHPESIVRLRQSMMDYPLDDARVRGFVKALGAVGSTVAQEALVAMAREHAANTDFASRVLTTLGFVARPSVEATQAVVAFAGESGDQQLIQRAKLAAGIMGSHLRQSDLVADQARAVELEAKMDQWLASATSDKERYDALAALGNLGPQHLAPIMKHISDSASAAVREEAYFALRAAPDPGVVEFLRRSYEAATGLDAGRDQAAVVRALAARPPDDAWFRVVSDLVGKALASGDAMALGGALVRAQDESNQSQVTALLDSLGQHATDPATKEQLTELRRGLAH